MLKNCFQTIGVGLIVSMIVAAIVIVAMIEMSKPNPDVPRGAEYVRNLNNGTVDSDFRK